MFSKPKSKADVASLPVPARTRPSSAAPSLISADIVLVGDVTAGGDIQIDGTIEGNLRSTSITIGETATVTGDIVADEVSVRGRVIGNISARRVQLIAKCHVEGDIVHETLAVEIGAYLEGSCRHSNDPLSAEQKPAVRGWLRQSEREAEPLVVESEAPVPRTILPKA